MRWKHMSAGALLLLFVTPTACAQGSNTRVEHAWARATAANAKTAAVYMTIESAISDNLVSASTPLADRAEVYTNEFGNDVMKMRKIDALVVQAGIPTVLNPSGLHVMLMGLKEPLKEGQEFPITLMFEKAGARTISVNVLAAGAMGPEDRPHGHRMSH